MTKTTENPTLAVAFGRVLREQRYQFANENEVNLRKSLTMVADRCATCPNTLQNIEAGSDDPGRSLLMRMAASGVYNFCGTKIFSISNVIYTIRKSSTTTAKNLFKNTPELVELIELSEQIKDRDCRSTFRDNIDRKGLSSALYRYLFDDPYLPHVRHRCYCEFASEEDLAILQKTQPVADYYSLDDYKKRWEKNPQMFTLAYKNDTKRQYLGQFRMTPLTEAATARSLKPIKGMPKADIDSFTESFGDCTSVDIGVGGINNVFTRGILMLELISQIEQLLAFTNISILFAHPLHHESKLLVDRFEFEEIPNSKMRFLMLNTRRLKNFGLKPAVVRYK